MAPVLSVNTEGSFWKCEYVGKRTVRKSGKVEESWRTNIQGCTCILELTSIL